jgi:hypothetical protein
VSRLGIASLACFVALAGCGADEPATTSTREPDAGTTGESGGSDLPQSDESVALDPADFTADVTNPWFPLEPATRWTYRETEDGEVFEVVVTATPVTRRIADGVVARVVRDTVTLEGEVVEDTFDWYAQDRDGTVWYLGEDTAELEDGRITTREGSFEAGIDGAQAGVIMPSTPEVGLTYRQEYLEGEAEDRGEVLALGQQATVPAGDYDDLLQTADTTPLEPDVLEHKFYAEGVGLVLTIDKDAGGREELLSVTHLTVEQARRAGQAELGQRY